MSTTSSRPSGWATFATLAPGLIVALGAAAATAHGLFEVVVGAKVPTGIAWIYPVITDGLAIVAYAATGRLPKPGRRYAWAVVILAAGLSGLAQAVYLAGAVAGSTGPAELPAGMRFGVGAWPAIAAAIVAHLLFMLAATGRTAEPHASRVDSLEAVAAMADRVAPSSVAVHPDRVQPPTVHASAVQSDAVQPESLDAAGSRTLDGRTAEQAETVQPESSVRPGDVEAKPVRPAAQPPSPKRDRARVAARKHQALHGHLPTVDDLMQLADVSRGTAGTALQELREQPAHLHVITEINSTKANS